LLLLLYQISLALLLFLLLFISIRQLGLALLGRHAARSRLSPERKQEAAQAGGLLHPVNRHIQDLLEVTRIIPASGVFWTVTLLLALAGIVCGIFVFQSFRGVAVLVPICTLMPYVMLRLRLISLQLRTRLEFLPAVEVFYQQVLLTDQPNIRNTLQAVVAGERLLYPVKASFEQLHRNLSAGRAIEDALRVFRLEHGHVWGDYYVSMLRMAIQDGVGIASNLKELIEDMRRAQLYDQKARNRLLEIRLASFSPVLFLGLFMTVNFKLNYENSLRFYLHSADGRNMLLNAILLIFGSFIMGIYLSMKRM
jgi:hypothetical protein